MKMVKKIITLLLCILMLTLTAFAKEEAAVPETKEEVIDATAVKVHTLSLNAAIQLALKDNPQLQACDIKKDSNEVQLNAARLDKIAYKKVPVSMAAYDINYVQKGYYVTLLEASIALSAKEKEQITASISYNVTEKYFNYKLLQRLVEISENAYKLSLENKTMVDSHFEMGLLSELEAKNAQISVNQTEANLNAYKRSLEISKEILKIELQLDGINCDFILTDNIDAPQFDFNIDEDIESSMSLRYDVSGLKLNYEMAKLYDEMTFEPMHTAVKANSYSKFIQSEYDYTKNSKLIALSVRNSYNEALSAKNNLEIAEKNLEIIKQGYEADKLQFELGMITNTALTSTLNNLASLEVNVENTKLAYALAVKKYQYEISIGL